MTNFKNWTYTLLAATGLFVAVAACKNNDQPAPVLSITSVSPTSGPIGSTVVITGTQFSATPASNTVTFGGNAAQILGASATSLTAVVPSTIGNGTIAVTSGGSTVQASQPFTLSNRPTVQVAADMTTNTNWTKNNIYVLRGFVNVQSGATLTIEPGTVIRGGGVDMDPSGQGRGATLIIRPGAKIMALGTVSQPIVFTSNKPAGQRGYGDWGGIVLVGKAPNNKNNEGLEGGLGGSIGAYNEPADNSGTLQYVRIEFPGIPLSNNPNSEINGLTLYGVGSGTTIDHIQVSYSGDDSYEWFGGTVNMKYLVALRGFDDDWDTDWGYTGKVQFGVALRDPQVADQSASNGFESDNQAGTGVPTGQTSTSMAQGNGLPLTAPVFANMSNFVFSTTPSSANTPSPGTGPYQSGMHLRRYTSISIFNSLFYGYPEGLRLDGKLNTTYANVTNGGLDLRGIVLANTGTGSTTVVRGADEITNAQAQEFFNLAARSNQIITTADAGTLLVSGAFNLTAPNFLPGTGSPLLTGAVWTNKGADAFFEKVTFRGAFGTTNWAKDWTNFDPQNTNYDR